jgi:hypothetical protein
MALFTAGRSPEASTAPNRIAWFLGVGILFAALLIVLVRSAEDGSRIAMFVATLVSSLWSLVAGVSGILLLFAWGFTRHHYMGRNENLLHFDPLSITLVVLVPLAIYGLRGVSTARKLSGWIAAISLVGFVAQGLPVFDQPNGEIIALALPINLAVVWVVFRLTTYRRTSRPSSAAL